MGEKRKMPGKKYLLSCCAPLAPSSHHPRSGAPAGTRATPPWRAGTTRRADAWGTASAWGARAARIATRGSCAPSATSEAKSAPSGQGARCLAGDASPVALFHPHAARPPTYACGRGHPNKPGGGEPGGQIVFIAAGIQEPAIVSPQIQGLRIAMRACRLTAASGRNFYADPAGLCLQCQSHAQFLRTLAIAALVGAVGAAITVK